ncbi:uncharacterized protein L969DRAFT_355921 [Mixia osmundae IAM 14324]|uniref:Uncharacterized protein n=1 Tax=Mixia osmundae (strain CBS 9802 / IAM 14324 / JCM 22182 / KY 12970) TaxID=764103 RepID=G7E5E3_MIXOS|nr:uncharacterized protein L969DRAFT_355921 [Mixia osmundae IAM 14324]KEI40796.1 hypothetical protein L969DRAFT_355921 [Mixia osmundae IAM 14324]GAA98053.1 hypothetical protein E5Q_04734 [Mixia osmundae IAM 14324]
MAFYTLSAVGLALLLVLAIYYYRGRLLLALPPSLQSRLKHYAPVSSFESALEQGYTSAEFDLSGNVDGSDPRAGLDEAALEEVRRIMDGRGCTFDQARLIRHQQHLRKNGIGPDGRPLDPKAITSLA